MRTIVYVDGFNLYYGSLRQQVYLRALATLKPLVSVHYGHYLTSKTRAALVTPPPHTVEVWRTEEKGSDVNLATYLLLDAFDGRMESAVVVSNDSDLKTPMQVARHRFNMTVGLINPHQNTSRALLPIATFVRQVRAGPLLASQFPDALLDERGEIRRPESWR